MESYMTTVIKESKTKKKYTNQYENLSLQICSYDSLVRHGTLKCKKRPPKHTFVFGRGQKPEEKNPLYGGCLFPY